MSWLQRLLALFYQQRCGGCGHWGAVIFCAACEAAWPPLPEPACSCCACPLDHGTCPDCEVGEWAFEATYAAAAYLGVARKAVGALKYAGARALAPVLAARVAPLPLDGEWLVVPVPIHRARRRERGYNQDLLTRRQAPPQQALDRAARLANLDGAFAARRSLIGVRVLLVDDVMTSGATAHHAAVALRRAGAVAVSVAVVARTLPPGFRATAESP